MTCRRLGERRGEVGGGDREGGDRKKVRAAVNLGGKGSRGGGHGGGGGRRAAVRDGAGMPGGGATPRDGRGTSVGGLTRGRERDTPASDRLPARQPPLRYPHAPCPRDPAVAARRPAHLYLR